MDVISAASLAVIASASAWGLTRWRLSVAEGDEIDGYDDEEPLLPPEPVDLQAQELARQLEAARIAAWSARHALTAAQQERDKYRGEVTALRAQLDEEVGRTRLAERLNVAARAARDEAVERRVQLEEAVQHLTEANEALQTHLVHNTSDPVELRAARADADAARAEVQKLQDALQDARRDLAQAQATLRNAPPIDGDLKAVHAELTVYKEMVEQLVVERDAAQTDAQVARAEIERIKDRLYKPPTRRT